MGETKLLEARSKLVLTGISLYNDCFTGARTLSSKQGRQCWTSVRTRCSAGCVAAWGQQKQASRGEPRKPVVFCPNMSLPAPTAALGELSPAAASLTSWKGSAGTVLCSAQVLPPGPIHPHEVSSRARCCLLAQRCPDRNSGHCQNVRRVGIPDPTSDTSGAPALLGPWHLRGGRRTFRVTTCVVTALWGEASSFAVLMKCYPFIQKARISVLSCDYYYRLILFSCYLLAIGFPESSSISDIL